MQEKNRVLWVEDSARFELPSLLGPIYASRRYDLTLAENATTAAEYLRRRRFDVIVVDIRIPPGGHQYWRRVYKDAGDDRTNAKLGLALLGWVLGSARTSDRDRKKKLEQPPRPTWQVLPSHIGVFSVESRIEVGPFLDDLGVRVMHEKRPGLPDTILLDIVAQVLGQGASGDMNDA